jgi:uncharacterized protein (TIGR03435 family)
MRLTLLLTCALTLFAQSRAFEVATVRRIAEVAATPSASTGGPPPPPPPPAIRPNPTGLTIDNASLQYCLGWAHNLRPWQIAGPDWIRNNRYAIAARAAGPVEPEQLKPMLAALLEERFRLVVRRDAMESRILALVVAPGGHKLKPADPTRPAERQFSPIPGGGLRLVAQSTPIETLEQILSLALWPPVVNRTGLSGNFDFTYERPPQDPANREGWLSDIQSSVRRQLGLALVGQRAPVDTLTVESGEQNPIAN